MKDDPLRKAIKRIVLMRYEIDLRFTRALRRRNGGKTYRLHGSCNGCGLCCERPTITTNRFFFRIMVIRRLLLAWHRIINGFEYQGEDARTNTFSFRCTHYDPKTRTCDSYESRPGMCRDYPRNLLDGPMPEFFPECSYYAILDGAEQFREALAATDMSPEKRAELEQRLHLVPPPDAQE